MASGRPRLLEAFRNRMRDRAIHQLLWSELLDYYFVGGMPEAVACWFDGREELLGRTRDVRAIHRNLISAYE